MHKDVLDYANLLQSGFTVEYSIMPFSFAVETVSG